MYPEMRLCITIRIIISTVSNIFGLVPGLACMHGRVRFAAGQQEYWDVFQKAYRAVMRHYRSGAWYDDADIGSGRSVHQQFQSLQAFWPGPPEAHAVLCCAVLRCAALCCVGTCQAALCCVGTCHAALCCAVLCCAVWAPVRLYCAVPCYAVQCHAVLCCAVVD